MEKNKEILAFTSGIAMMTKEGAAVTAPRPQLPSW